MSDTPQAYGNHRRYVTGYHFVLSLLLLIALGGSVTMVYRALRAGSGRLATATILIVVICLLLQAFYLRVFALKAQDRAIRAEENLRHFALHGSPLDSRLTIRQVIGLRFASDAELGDLAKRAAEEGLSEDQIKKQIKDWRPDTYRV